MAGRPGNANRLRRVAVVGASCSGKTTFSDALATALDVPRTDLDELYWGPNWKRVPTARFEARVERAVAAPAWVIDGGYAGVRDRIWTRATALVWLNLSFRRVFSRALSRTIKRIVTREELVAGNRETLLAAFGRDAIPRWTIRTFRRCRREYPRLLRRSEYAHLRVFEFTHPREIEAFLAACRAVASGS